MFLLKNSRDTSVSHTEVSRLLILQAHAIIHPLFTFKTIDWQSHLANIRPPNQHKTSVGARTQSARQRLFKLFKFLSADDCKSTSQFLTGRFHQASILSLAPQSSKFVRGQKTFQEAPSSAVQYSQTPGTIVFE